jgi:hypothetical protein
VTHRSIRSLTATGPHSLPALPQNRNLTSAANPFYDVIRQNRELSSGITERIPLVLPPHIIARKSDLPFKWLRGIVKQSERPGDEGSEALAMQFYILELREQKRLLGIMDHHSKESGLQITPPSTMPILPKSFKSPRELNASGHPLPAAYFPYSITAGVEKGDKNRYPNIWPFDHARVRLAVNGTGRVCDYVNASYIQPRGTKRKYIATQGPLQATFNDFWT